MQLLTLIVISTICTSNSFGQTNAEITIDRARQAAYAKDFEAADKILSAYNEQHINIHALRLHAQVLYWMQDFDRAEEVYKGLQKNFPENDEVKLDYGRFLYEMGKIGASEKMLNEYLVQNPDHPEANLMMSYINIWNGRLAKAKQRALKIKSLYPENQEFQILLEEIRKLSAPALGISGITYSDDQPLKFTGLLAEGSWYQSWWFSPSLSFSSYGYNSFDQGFNTRWLRAGNSIYLKSKTTIGLKGGVFFPANNHENVFTGGVSLKQQISGSLNLKLEYENVPYQYTAESILSPFTFSTYKGALNLENKKNNLLGEAGFQQQVFPDDNSIKSAYFWILFPLINESNFKLGGGYSFNYTTSEETTFVVESTSGGGGTGFPPVFSRPTVSVEGFYENYFTPINQQINSFLANMQVGNEKTNLNIGINLGFFAAADSPSGESGATVLHERVTYTPLEIESSLNIGIAEQLNLSGKYRYQSLFFFNAHLASLQLTYKFL
ncbi:MAG: tetratricopeptide repeat protein [Candidatus Cyclobacteriaceae bacterium M2_1C_046]